VRPNFFRKERVQKSKDCEGRGEEKEKPTRPLDIEKKRREGKRKSSWDLGEEGRGEGYRRKLKEKGGTRSALLVAVCEGRGGEEKKTGRGGGLLAI